MCYYRRVDVSVSRIFAAAALFGPLLVSFLSGVTLGASPISRAISPLNLPVQRKCLFSASSELTESCHSRTGSLAFVCLGVAAV